MAHDLLVNDLLAAGRLVKPFAHSAPLAAGYFLMPPSSHAQTPASAAFLNWIEEEFQQGG